ncbi:unnamed protein product [Agarophyton chilense]
MMFLSNRSRSVPTSVQLAALQVLGNVACGDDQQTQVVIDSEALPCLRSLLFSSDRQIRKEVCWIVSNITESSHQVQDVLDADILPPLLKLLDNQDGACREDATWVLFNLSSNRVPNQIAYLAENDGVRALCNLLSCQKELDVLWKGCGTVAAVALKGLRNILISGQVLAASNQTGYNEMAALVAEAHGVERIEALTTHSSPDVGNRARLILERIFGAEPSMAEALLFLPTISGAHIPTPDKFPCPPSPPAAGHSHCSCNNSDSQTLHHKANYYHGQGQGLCDLQRGQSLSSGSKAIFSNGLHEIPSHALETSQSGADIIETHESSSGSSTDSEPDDDDSDSDLIPSPPAPCSCVLCSDLSPLADRRPRGRLPNSDDLEANRRNFFTAGVTARPICYFCVGGGRLGDGRAGLAAKLGRAVRLGHPHCLAILLSKMTWSQRIAATEAPALLHPGGGPNDGSVGSSLPAVILAAQLGKPQCLSMLLKRCQPNLALTFGKKRLTALAWAAHKGYLRCCQLLLEHGADPATKCGEAVTALHLAASGRGHTAVCKLLIDYMAPVNSKSSKKQTPLCLAAQKGYSSIVRLLLEYGADPNNQDEGKYTPLHLAASKGYLETVNVLLIHGAFIDATTRNEVTPLHYAVQGGHSQSVRALIARGAKVNCSKKPLLLIAADDGNLEIVNLLLNAKASIDCKANIRAALDKETEVSDYLTPLHLASSKNYCEVVEALVRRGANVNEVTSKSGWSPLDFAVLNGHSESSKILLRHGALVTDNCKSVGRNNWTLVQHAASNGAKDVVRLLIQRIKEQRSNLPTSASDDSVSSLMKPSVPKNCVAGAFGDALGSRGLMNKYVVNENDNMHTCRACSKLRKSSCATQRNRDGFLPQKAIGRVQDCNELGFLEQGESLTRSLARSDVPSTDSDVKQYSPRREVAKDERQSALRAREIKKRETEAREARDRLEEAISQRSVSKLTEAISHVNKLVLHLATPVSGDVNSSHLEYTDPVEDSIYQDAYTHARHIQAPDGNVTPKHPHSISLAPLDMEVGLGNEVQKAQKMLAGLLAEEKRAREEKQKEAMDSKRGNAEEVLKKAVSSALDGGDPRSLARAVNRATRTILEIDNPVVVEATQMSGLLSRLEKHEHAMKIAVDSGHLEALEESLIHVKKHVSTLINAGGTGATNRLFGGRESETAIADAELALKAMREKREREEAEQQEAMNQEQKVNEELQEAMKLDDISRLETILNRAHEVLLSKTSALANTIEAAKKVKARRLKLERRKLRQANNTKDPLKIEEAAVKAEQWGLSTLRHDVDAAKAHAQKLREQAAAAEDLENAMSYSDIPSLTALRTRLNSLGMFIEAELARAQLERLQRAVRVGTLLEAAVRECSRCHEHIKSLVDDETADGVMDSLSTCRWPDVQRLRDLSFRARRHGSTHNSICESADILYTQLVSVCRRILEVCIESGDARAIAATIAGFERTFTGMKGTKEFERANLGKTLETAKQHLAHVQAMDQASVKAESAQVKVEYALATSRRSAARIRQTKSGIITKSEKHASGGNSAEKGDALRMRDTQKLSTVISSENERHKAHIGTTSMSENDHDDSFPSIPKKVSSRKHSREEYGSRDSLESPSITSGECSHFYLFKEGNTVYCARCGNHRSSSNPEWLARVKRRGNSIPEDLKPGWTQGSSELSDPNVNLRNLYLAYRNTSFDMVGVDRPRDPSAHADSIPPAQASSAGFPHGKISPTETARNAPVATAASTANVMAHMFQHHVNSLLLSGANNHGRGQQIPVSTSIRTHVQNMFQNDVSTVSTLQSGITASNSEIISSPLSETRNPSTSTRTDEQLIPVRGYGITGSALSLDAARVLHAPSIMAASSALSRRGILTESRASCGPELRQNNEISAELHVDRTSVYEETADTSRDFCMDFENENFGFDIDAIVEEPAPLVSKTLP